MSSQLRHIRTEDTSGGQRHADSTTLQQIGFSSTENKSELWIYPTVSKSADPSAVPAVSDALPAHSRFYNTLLQLTSKSARSAHTSTIDAQVCDLHYQRSSSPTLRVALSFTVCFALIQCGTPAPSPKVLLHCACFSLFHRVFLLHYVRYSLSLLTQSHTHTLTHTPYHLYLLL